MVYFFISLNLILEFSTQTVWKKSEKRLQKPLDLKRISIMQILANQIRKIKEMQNLN